MTILNQNRDILINFDNIVGIQVNNSRLEMVISYNEGIIIGKYKNKERAKEVLQEIIRAKSDFGYYKCTSESERNEIDSFMKTKYEFFDTYEMPKE